MASPVRKLEEIGLTLPQAAAPAANYVPYVISGNHLYIAGQIPFLNGGNMKGLPMMERASAQSESARQKVYIGKVGEDLTLEQGIEAARACALNILAQADAAVGGDWNKIERCVKLGGFVNCTPDFTDHPKIINGASDLMVAVLGDAGKHARFAVGAPSLPLGVAVEIDAIFAMKD